MRFRNVSALLVAAACVAALTGCSKQQSTSQSGKKLSFVLCPKSLNNPYYDNVKTGMNEAAKRLGVEAVFVAPVDADAAKQAAMIEDVVTRGADGIAVSAFDPDSVIAPINAGRKKGIPMITFDSDAPKSDRICFIGADSYKAGVEAGKAMVKLLNGQGKIITITGGLGSYNLNQRIKGFNDAIKSSPGMKLVGSPLPCNDSQAIAHQLIEDSLKAHPEVNAIFANGLWAVIPAGNILLNTGRAGKVVVVGFEALKPELELVKKGGVQALIGLRPEEIGSKSVETLYDIKMGKMPKSKTIMTGLDVITKDNVDQFLKK